MNGAEKDKNEHDVFLSNPIVHVFKFYCGRLSDQQKAFMACCFVFRNLNRFAGFGNARHSFCLN